MASHTVLELSKISWDRDSKVKGRTLKPGRLKVGITFLVMGQSPLSRAMGSRELSEWLGSGEKPPEEIVFWCVLTFEAHRMQPVVGRCTIVLSRLDYCNSVLVGLPANLIQRLQSVQNAAARFIYTVLHQTFPAHYRRFDQPPLATCTTADRL